VLPPHWPLTPTTWFRPALGGWLFLVLWLLFPAAGSAGGDKPGGEPPFEKRTTAELIDELQEESEQGVGTHATAWVSGFLPLDEEPEFRGGILGSREPATSAVLRELVWRGVAALPDLLQHIDDRRPTKLVITHTGGFGSMWFSDEYDPRYAEPKKVPSNTNTGLEKSDGFEKRNDWERRYTIRVGDLCFVAVGQIVNRGLSVVRYQPTLCIVINSPVETPALARAVRKDWAGLTAEQHRQSLSQDALSKYPSATRSALKRLLFYYPREGEALALKLLARPLYDDDALWTFIEERLVTEDEPDKWKALIDQLGRERGPAATAALPFRLHGIYLEPPFERTKKFLQGQERARKILARFYPDYDPSTPPFINAASAREQQELVGSLGKHRTKEIDDAVYRGFQAAVQPAAGALEDREDADVLACACMGRLLGKGHDDEFRAWLRKRIRAVEALPEKSAGRRVLELLGDCAKDLMK
jgi:hypothetical protein